MSKPLLIVTPTLGRSPYWASTIASIAELETPHHHCIVCPVTARPHLAKAHPNALVVGEKPGTLGLYHAINQGVEAAGFNWEWLTYINDDDLVYPGVDTCLRQSHSDTDVGYGEVDKVAEDGRVIEPISTLRSSSLFLPLAAAGISGFNQQGAIIRQRLWSRIGPLDTTLRICADFEFFIRAAIKGARFEYHPVKTGAFRIRKGQISQDIGREVQEKGRIFKQYRLNQFTPWSSVAMWIFRLQNTRAYFRRVIRGKFYTSHEMLAGAKS